MTGTSFAKRLATLEATCATAPARFGPQEIKGAARLYEATLTDPSEPDERATPYWAGASLPQLAADYAVMIGGGPAPWE